MSNRQMKHTRRIIKRTCVVCGKKITVKVNPNRSYTGGHYFGKIPTEKGEVEYWECEKCFQEEDTSIPNGKPTPDVE